MAVAFGGSGSAISSQVLSTVSEEQESQFQTDSTKFRSFRVSTSFVPACLNVLGCPPVAPGRPAETPRGCLPAPFRAAGLPSPEAQTPSPTGRGGAPHRSRPLTQLDLFSMSFCVNVSVCKRSRLWMMNLGEGFIRSFFFFFFLSLLVYG